MAPGLPFSLRSPRKTHHLRRGSASKIVIGVLAAIGMIAAGFWLFSGGETEGADQPMLTAVSRGPYELVVVEQGEVDSSNNVEIRCEVKARGTSGTAIIEVIPEGTLVNEGDLLVQLDASSLDRDRDTQQIAVNTTLATMVQAESTLEAAKVAKEEYLQGAYKQEEQLVLSEIFVAEENLKRSQLSVESGERLAAKGLVTSLQLDGDRFAVEKSRNELDSAKTKLKVLQEFTRRKNLIQFDSDIKTAEVKFANEKKNYEVELKKLDDIEQQIAKCTIRAPQHGQVVYANVTSSRGGSSEFVVEPGSLVREQQVIVRLPDPTQMQVKARINESRITLVRPEMPVAIRIDAFGDEPLDGQVKKVNQYAEPTSWFGSQVKEYATFIDILDPPPGIRPGLTAEVRIHVEDRSDTLQIPVQALYEHKGHTFCLVKKGMRYETREVKFESTNDKTVALNPGVLDEGEQVVLNPRKHSDKLALPHLPDPPTREQRVASRGGDKKGGAPRTEKGGGGPSAAATAVNTSPEGASAKGARSEKGGVSDKGLKGLGKSESSASSGVSE